VTELLARADDLALQNKSYQEVYAAMAQSLSEAWIDLNKQLDYRKLLLDQSISFHESALQVGRSCDSCSVLSLRPSVCFHTSVEEVMLSSALVS